MSLDEVAYAKSHSCPYANREKKDFFRDLWCVVWVVHMIFMRCPLAGQVCVNFHGPPNQHRLERRYCGLHLIRATGPVRVVHCRITASLAASSATMRRIASLATVLHQSDFDFKRSFVIFAYPPCRIQASALTAYLRVGKCVCLFFCFWVTRAASLGESLRRMARVCLARRSRGRYFFFE